MNEFQEHVRDVTERAARDAMNLRLKAEALAARVQRASERSWQTLSHYRRAVAVLDRLLGRTAGQQQRALSLSRRLRECGRTARDLRRRIEYLGWLEKGNPSPQLDAIRRDVQAVERIIAEWGEEPDPCKKDTIDGD